MKALTNKLILVSIGIAWWSLDFPYWWVYLIAVFSFWAGMFYRDWTNNFRRNV